MGEALVPLYSELSKTDKHDRGRIETPMQLQAEQAAKEAGTSQAFANETLTDISLRRKGKPEEVAKLIAFLLSDESSYISGNAVGIDGGWNC